MCLRHHLAWCGCASPLLLPWHSGAIAKSLMYQIYSSPHVRFHLSTRFELAFSQGPTRAISSSFLLKHRVFAFQSHSSYAPFPRARPWQSHYVVHASIATSNLNPEPRRRAMRVSVRVPENPVSVLTFSVHEPAIHPGCLRPSCWRAPRLRWPPRVDLAIRISTTRAMHPYAHVCAR